MTNFEKVKEFMTTFGQEVKTNAEFPNDKIVELRKKLNLCLQCSKHFTCRWRACILLVFQFRENKTKSTYKSE